MSWSHDESGNLTVDGAKVSYTGQPNNKANAIWSNGGSGYWEFKLSGDTGIWLGVSSKEKFAAGYGIKGLFYGGPGNLSDGSSLVRGEWGPKLENDDVVGMKVEQNSEKTQISFSHNGTGLGTAFDIDNWKGELFPAVSLNKPGQSATLSQGDLSSAHSMQDARSPAEGILGNWIGKFPLTIISRPSEWRVSVHICNSYGTVVQPKEDGSLKAVRVIGTKRMAPAEQQGLEQEAVKFLEGIVGWRREGDKLVVDSSAGKYEFSYAPPASPANKPDIGWMN